MGMMKTSATTVTREGDEDEEDDDDAEVGDKRSLQEKEDEEDDEEDDEEAHQEKSQRESNYWMSVPHSTLTLQGSRRVDALMSRRFSLGQFCSILVRMHSCAPDDIFIAHNSLCW